MIIFILLISLYSLYDINSDLQIENEDQEFWEITKFQRQFLSHEIIINKGLKHINKFTLQKYFENNSYGCQKYNKNQKRYGNTILIKSSRCSLIKKSYNAFLHGFKAIFIYGDYEEMTKSQKLFPDIAIIKLRAKQARRLKNFIRKKKKVVELSLKIIPININIKYIMNVQSLLSYKKLQEIKDLIFIFKDLIQFQPIYKFIDLRQYYSQFVLQEFCYDQGRFCLKQKKQLSTKYFLKEQVKQMCLYDIQENSRDFSDSKNQWWNYIQYYPNCLIKKLSGKKIDCIKKYFKDQKILLKIEQCFKNSFLQPLNKYISENIYLRLKNDSSLKNKKVKSILIADQLLLDNSKQDFYRQKQCKVLKKSQTKSDNTILLSISLLTMIQIIKRLMFNQLIFQLQYLIYIIQTMTRTKFGRQFLTLIYSRRFIRDRKLWLFLTAIPGLYWFSGEFLKVNEVLTYKADNTKYKTLQNFLYTDEVITKEEWEKYQDYIVYNQRR